MAYGWWPTIDGFGLHRDGMWQWDCFDVKTEIKEAKSNNQKFTKAIIDGPQRKGVYITVKPVCNDHLYDKIYYMWFI